MRRLLFPEIADITDLDLEASVVNKVIHSTQEYFCGLSTPQEVALLNEMLERLDKGGVGLFSSTIFYDIIHVIREKLKLGHVLSSQGIVQEMENMSCYKEQDIKSFVNNILLKTDIYLVATSLGDMVQILEERIKKRRLESALKQKASENSPDIAALKKIVDDLSAGLNAEKVEARLSKRLQKYRESPDPVTRAVSKLEMKSEGLTPFEVNELIADSSPPRDPPVITEGRAFLLKDFNSSGWIYPALIPQGVVTLLSGQAGSGKTSLAYHLMLCYLGNKPFLGETPTGQSVKSQKKGLIINADQPPSDAQEMLRSSPDSFGRSISFDVIENGWTLLDLLELEKAIQTNHYTFIVIDSYKAIHSHLGNWDENAPIAGLGIRELQRICSTYGVTIIVIHHAGHVERKGGHQSRGSSSIPDAASCVISISQPPMERAQGDRNNSLRFLDITKIRNAERCQLMISFNPSVYGYDLCLDAAGTKRSRVNSLAAKLLPLFARDRKTSLYLLLQKECRHPEEKPLYLSAIKKLEMRGEVRKEVQLDEVGDVFYQRL